MPTKTDIVDLAIGYDEGWLTKGGIIRFGAALVDTGLVNSTGSYQRLVSMLIDGGYLDAKGKVTEKGQEIIEEDE